MAEEEGSVETGNPEWDTGLDDYRETIDAKGWKSAGDVLQSYQNLEKAVGGWVRAV